MKSFNVTGTCFPDKHYMVDITDRVEVLQSMVADGKYFCINRARQYGKTTTLAILREKLQQDYTVFSLSFENISSSAFASDEALAAIFLWLLYDQIAWEETQINTEAAAVLEPYYKDEPVLVPLNVCANLLAKLCKLSLRKIVLLIDEVDQASNYGSFIKFLGMLRSLYLKRELRPTFQSVILSSVYDIKNLKLKVRPEVEHEYNSPWNIDAGFDCDMSLSEAGIAKMLTEYAQDTNREVDVLKVAQLIRASTAGYPYLVSRLCMLMDASGAAWSRESFLVAERQLLKEKNTLFDDLSKKLAQFPELKHILYRILYNGERFTYDVDVAEIGLGKLFGFIKEDQGFIAISNRIFESKLYNIFVAETGMFEQIYKEGSADKNIFIKHGSLDMRLVLERFIVHFTDIYGARPVNFLEKEGRRYFMLFLKPIINGTGNMYIETQTRDETRTDLVVDYLGKQYIVELKIWRGDAYNMRGEEQLSAYLDYFHVDTGYMLSFCFNKNKKPGVHEVRVGDKIIVEAVV